MPPKTKRQARFLGPDYQRAKQGVKTKTGLGTQKLKELLKGK